MIEKPEDVVNEQAEDEALWTIWPHGTPPIGEAMLQEALRRLHAAIEGKEFSGYKGKYIE